MTAYAGWFLAGCIAAALVLLCAGCIAALRAVARVKRHSETLLNAPLFHYANEANDETQRILDALDEMTPLLERARAAIELLQQSAADLRVPQAVAAVRMSIAAVRLLTSGR